MVALTHSLNQDGFRIGSGFQRLGYRVSYFDYQRENPTKLMEMAQSLKPDFVFVTKGQGLHRATLRKVRAHTTRLVMWYPDAYLPTDKGYGCEFLAEILPVFDTVLVNYRGLVASLARYNKECHFAPAFFDNHFLGIDKLTPEDLSVFGCDAVFIGNNQKVYGRERVAALKAISRMCKLKVWGLGWGLPLPRTLISIAATGLPATPGNESLRLRVWSTMMKPKPPIKLTSFARAVMGKELLDNSVSKAYHCSKVGLNVGTLHLRAGDIDLGFSDRLYKCMGNSAPYLTPPIKNIEEWFVPGREIALYRSRKELVEWTQYLLRNEAQRVQIGKSGFAKIMRFHTIDIRIKQYLTLIEGGMCPFDCRH
jgi:hypothetical protein